MRRAASLGLLVLLVALWSVTSLAQQAELDPNSAKANSAPFETEPSPVEIPVAAPAEPKVAEPQPVAAPTETKPAEPPSATQSPAPESKNESPASTFPGWEEIRAKTNDALDAAGTTPAGTPEGNEAASDTSFMSNVYRVVAVLCFVLMLIIVSRVLIKPLVVRRTTLLGGSHFAKLLGRVYLDPRTALHFVAVKDKVLVLGVTQSSVNLVGTFDASAFAESQAAEVSPGVDTMPVDFLSALRSSNTLPAASAPEDDTEIASLRGDIARLQRYLKEGPREPSE